jgi:hypothetical protein
MEAECTCTRFWLFLLWADELRCLGGFLRSLSLTLADSGGVSEHFPCAARYGTEFLCCLGLAGT